jgi:hypothetical protein
MTRLPLLLVGILLLHRTFFIAVTEGLRSERIVGRRKEEEVEASVEEEGNSGGDGRGRTQEAPQ